MQKPVSGYFIISYSICLISIWYGTANAMAFYSGKYNSKTNKNIHLQCSRQLSRSCADILVCKFVICRNSVYQGRYEVYFQSVVIAFHIAS